MFLLKAEAESVKSHICELQLLRIINGINFDFALREAATKLVSLALLKGHVHYQEAYKK